VIALRAPAGSTRAALGRRLLPTAVYVAAAVVLTWPLAVNLTNGLGAMQGVGDPFLNLWILGWGMRAWTSDPSAVLSGRVFDANIFHPAEGTLTYSDHFLLQAFALAPVFAITRDAVLCYNLLVIGSIALSGLAMHVFVRAVTGSERGAYLAGLAWACWPYRTAHLLHIQLQALYFMPLALLCLHRVAAGRRWRDAFALALVTMLQLTASVYYGLMTGIALAVAGIGLAGATGQWRRPRLWSRLVGAAALVGVLSVPVLLPYMRSQQSEGFGRSLYQAANHSAGVQSYTQVHPVNLVYGRTGILDPRDPAPGERDRRGVEDQMFPGVVLLLLAAIGVWRHWSSDARSVVTAALMMVVTGFVLSMGPEGARGLYALLHDNVYGFQAIRAPARFAVIFMAGAALLAALGARSLPPRLATGLLILLSIEYLNAPLPLAAAPPRTTAVGQWLAQEPLPGAVLHLPLTIDIENTPFMVQSLEHGRPIVNGYSGQRPPFYSALVESLSDLPSPTAYAALREIDVRFVVSPVPVAGVSDPSSPLVERARLPGGTIYEVRWTPEALAALERLSGPPPPPPGRAPFAAGERAVYDVYWDGGPVNLPAGRATVSVTEGQPDGPRWQFETRAETANWVSTFFEAQDRFTTTTDAALLPIEHARAIREGRRALDRTYVYDRDARHVRIGASREAALGAEALVLPLGSEYARDAVSALYYVRTLPLAPGTQVSVPLNEAGTSLMLLVAVGEAETIEHGGRQVPVLRLEPRIMRRIERRRPVAMTVWLSADEHRVPVRLIVEAGFGRVRVELIDYAR
jgi:hypothetical protein